MKPYMYEYLEYLEKQEVLCLTEAFEVLKETLLSKVEPEDAEKKVRFYEKKHIELTYLKKIITIPKEQWINEKIIFDDLYALSKNLLSSPLKSKDKVSIIFSIIERNISTGITNEKIGSKVLGINREEFCENSSKIYEKFKDKIQKDTIDFSDLIELLNKTNDKEDAVKMYECFEDTIADMTEAGHNNRIIKEHYFDKLETFNEKDIAIIISTLINMGLVEEMAKVISHVLISKLYKRENTTNKKEYVITEKKKEKNKSYNEIQQELLKYYNFSESMITTKERISLNEIIKCINLLTEVGANKEDLYTFIKAAKIANNSYEINPIVLYNEQYYKLEYYKEKLGLETEFDNLKDLYQELFLLGGEDYEFGKKMLETDLHNYLKYLPNNSDYEIEESKKLTKTANLS